MKQEIEMLFIDDDYIYSAAEGTGDNLLDEDVAEGYVDYIMVNMYKQEGAYLEEVDGGQLMLKKLVRDMTEEEIEQAIKGFWFGNNNVNFKRIK